MNAPQPTTAPLQPLSLGSFWPMLLLAVSLAIILVWNVILGVREYSAATRMNDQLREALFQAGQTEENVRAMFMELLTLAVTDPEAKALVEKYNVRYTPPAATPAVAPATSPATPPAVAPAATPPATPAFSVSPATPTNAPRTGKQ